MIERPALKALLTVLFICAVVAGTQWYLERRDAAADGRGYDRAVAEHRERENKALKDALADRDRLAKELQDVSQDARTKTAALVDAQRAAADAGGRLRDALAALRRRAQCTTAAAGGSATADAAEGMLADVQRRLDEAAERVAGFADASRIAGLACERSYDALK